MRNHAGPKAPRTFAFIKADGTLQKILKTWKAKAH